MRLTYCCLVLYKGFAVSTRKNGFIFNYCCSASGETNSQQKFSEVSENLVGFNNAAMTTTEHLVV